MRNRTNMNNAILGAVNRRGRVKGTISSIHDPSLTPRSKNSRFIDDSDSLMMLITRYEAYISRSGNFRADDNNRWTN